MICPRQNQLQNPLQFFSDKIFLSDKKNCFQHFFLFKEFFVTKKFFLTIYFSPNFFFFLFFFFFFLDKNFFKEIFLTKIPHPKQKIFFKEKFCLGWGRSFCQKINFCLKKFFEKTFCQKISQKNFIRKKNFVRKKFVMDFAADFALGKSMLIFCSTYNKTQMSSSNSYVILTMSYKM